MHVGGGMSQNMYKFAHIHKTKYLIVFNNKWTK